MILPFFVGVHLRHTSPSPMFRLLVSITQQIVFVSHCVRDLVSHTLFCSLLFPLLCVPPCFVIHNPFRAGIASGSGFLGRLFALPNSTHKLKKKETPAKSPHYIHKHILLLCVLSIFSFVCFLSVVVLVIPFYPLYHTLFIL